jgi:hypothetical protein
MSAIGKRAGPLCVVCGDVLGVYEPVIVLCADQPARRTSRAAEATLPQGCMAMHEPCYLTRPSLSDDLSRPAACRCRD